MSHKEPTNCPVCFNPFDTSDYIPKIFPVCGHTICKNCLYQVVRNYTPKCPLDQIPFDREFRSIDTFPTNLIALNLIENNMKYPKCQFHPEEREKVICITDKKMICTDCVLLGDHKDHEVRSLSEAQNLAKIKESQLKDILAKIKTNVSQHDKSIQEKEGNIKDAIKERFSDFYKTIENHEAQMLSQVESVLREEKPRAKNPRLRDKTSEIERKLLELSSLISTPQCAPEVIKILEEDISELEKTVANELNITSQKIEEFTGIFAVFEDSLPQKDLLKDINVDVLEQNLAEWKKNRIFSFEEGKELIIPSAISLKFKGDTFLEVEFKEEGSLLECCKRKFSKKSTDEKSKLGEYLAYEKSKLDQVEEVSYGSCVNDENDNDKLLPALRNLSKSLPSVKFVSFNFDIRTIRSNKGFCNTIAALLSQPEHVEKLKFSFEENDYVKDLAFIFLAETVLPKIKNLTSFCIKMEKSSVSGETLKALAQVNWKSWQNLEEFRVDIPRSPLRVDMLQSPIRVDIPQSSFKESEILEFLNCVPNIKRLSLGFGNIQLADSALIAFSTKILPSLDKLERLEVGFWNTKVTDVGVETFLMNLPNIEGLLIGLRRTGITENVIKLFLESKLPSLTKLKEFQFGASEDRLSEDIVEQLCIWEQKINQGVDDFRSWHKTWRDPRTPKSPKKAKLLS